MAKQYIIPGLPTPVYLNDIGAGQHIAAPSAVYVNEAPASVSVVAVRPVLFTVM